MIRELRLDAWHFREDGDGRTVEGRIVPYMEPAIIVEPNPLTGKLEKYREQFLPGSCARMVQGAKARGSANFIKLLIGHTDSFDTDVGYAQSLREEDDGAYAVFRLHDDPTHLTKVRSMLRESHTGLSLNFADVKEPKVIDGIVSRVQVHVTHVAATPTPAYAGAAILAMREESLEEVPTFGTPNLDAVKAWLEDMRRVPA